MPSLVTPRFSRFSFNFNQVLSPKSPKPHSDFDAHAHANAAILHLPNASTTSATASPVDVDPTPRHGWSSFPAPDSKLATATMTTAGNPAPSSTQKSLQPQLYAIEYHSTSSTASPQTPWNATFNRGAASARHETRYLVHGSVLRYARIVSALLMIAGNASMLGMQADTYARYTRTLLPLDSTGWRLSLWPRDLNVTPTILLIVASGVSTLLNLLYLITACIPTPASRHWQNTLFATTTLTTFLLALIALIYTAAITPGLLFSTFVRAATIATAKIFGAATVTGLSTTGSSSPHAETLYSFTCHVANSAHAYNADATLLQLPNLSPAAMNSMIPSGFGVMCRTGEVSMGLLAAVTIVGFGSLVVAALGFGNDAWIGRRREVKRLESRKGSKGSGDSDGVEKKIEMTA